MWFRTLSPQLALNVTVQYAPGIGVRQQSGFAFGMERAPAVRSGGKRFHSPPRFRRIRQMVFGNQRRKTRRNQGHCEFPFGDFENVQLAAESRAGQYQHYNIESATARLHGMLDGPQATSSPKRSRAASSGRAARGARHPMR